MPILVLILSAVSIFILIRLFEPAEKKNQRYIKRCNKIRDDYRTVICRGLMDADMFIIAANIKLPKHTRHLQLIEYKRSITRKYRKLIAITGEADMLYKDF
jgi:hypothetical protein